MVAPMKKAIYGLYINLDERGDFQADVRDINDKTVFEMDTFQAEELVIDGFVRDPRDPDQIESHLRDVGVIPQDAYVYNSDKFERLQERILEKSGASLSA